MNIPKIQKEHKKAFSDSFLIICFTVMPTILTISLIEFGIIKKDFSTLYDDGELLLYSISFLGSAYIIYKQLNNELFKSYGNIIVALLFLISCLYSAASFASEDKKTTVIFSLSIIFLIISIPFLFNSQVMSNKETTPNIREYRNDEQEKIENALK